MDFLSRFKRGADRETPRAQPAEVARAERYRCVDFTAFPMGDQTDLVYPTGQGPAQLLPAELVEMVHRCSRFATLREHARDRCRELGLADDQVQPLARQLGELVQGGLLISYSELLNRCQQAADPGPGVTIASVGLVTRNRPDALERGLTSYVENATRYGRAAGFVVMDDSEGLATRQRTREMLRAFKTRFGVSISYAGLEEKTRFAEALAREAGGPPEVVRFALFDPERCGRSVGANHNAHLLHTVGEAFFSADDDTLCRIAAPPESSEVLACLSRNDPREFWFFPNR